MSRKKVKRRVVLGEGHPWYYEAKRGDPTFSAISLTAERAPVTRDRLVSFDNDGTGNWNRVRLVLEVLD